MAVGLHLVVDRGLELRLLKVDVSGVGREKRTAEEEACLIGCYEVVVVVSE